jgi:phosphatidylglycerophosphate synthase
VSEKFEPNDVAHGSRWLTLPNLITCLRIVGSPGLVVLAYAGQPMWLGLLAILLVFTEFLDGFIARCWHAESATGARLDTIADALFYSALLASAVILDPTLIGPEVNWIAAAAGSYLLSWLTSLVKFRCLPSYHTWAAKGSWPAVATGIACLLAGWSAWPFRIAMVCVVLTNLEATAITLVLSQCRVNIPSLWHACRDHGAR